MCVWQVYRTAPPPEPHSPQMACDIRRPVAGEGGHVPSKKLGGQIFLGLWDKIIWYVA